VSFETCLLVNFRVKSWIVISIIYDGMALDEAEKEELQKDFPFDFKYEPNAEEILNTLIPEAYTNTLFTAQLDALAAEHGSRMSAMDSAVGNCKEVIRSLTLEMNKLRQAAITTELIEVISGAESLDS
jgi:F-type H+-transporting ATPase subunit gamma